MMMRQSICELHEYSWQQVESLVYETLEPVVCRQAFQNWPPLRLWSPAYLKQRIGPQPVQVDVSQDPEFPALDPQSRHDHLMSVDDLLNRIQQPSPPYYFLNSGAAFYNLGVTPPTLSALHADISMTQTQQPDLLVKSLLWISGPGVQSRLHFDGNACHNLNVQVAGRKEFLLLAPQHAASLQLLDDPDRRYLAHFSLLDNVAVHADTVLPKDLPRWHVTLEPGDALIIPALWFHAVHSLDALNINVNYWSIAGQAYLGRLLTQLSR
jgi:hypothetical protein